MNSDEIRAKFVRYFGRQGHLHLPSASLVVHGDPSVLLTSAGMQPFNPYYVDPSKAPARRIVTIQRCMRTSDIEEVGDDTHYSFFEMLGNFAFGDLASGGYFKPEAIAFAFEVVTREYGLPPERIWVTTWAGEPGIPADDEAVALWRAIGIPPTRIRPLNRKPDGSRENFWGPTGDTGPCGPCTEIHADRFGRCPQGRSDEECGPPGRWEGRDAAGPIHDCGRFVEIWNLVFNQYYQERDKTLVPLAQTGIDTGSGLERVAAVLQGVPSGYETDLLLPIVKEAEAALDAPYGEEPSVTRGVRIIVDHARAVTFMAADGVHPSNQDRGYVARRLLRRAVRYGRLLGHEGPFMARLAHATIDHYAQRYPHLLDRRAVIERVIAQEEARFGETLSAGLNLLSRELDRLVQSGARALPGATAFRLYDTFGFPLELTTEVAAGRGFDVDTEEFNVELRRQRERSRGGSRFAEQTGLDLPAMHTAFEGYERLAVDGARIELLRQGGERVTTAEAAPAEAAPAVEATEMPDGEVWVVLDRTPFYAEGGGQVGDRGWIVGPHGRLVVRTTQSPVAGVSVHVGRVVEGYLTEGEVVRAAVDEPARRATMRHHTATHLLHAALRAELGPHVHQAGSLVAPDRLRFDFAHGQPLTPEQRRAVQRRVNDAIRRNLPVRTDVMPVEAAMQSGALALFDERYGETARVLTIGDVSKELCGGTHVAHTGEIGTFVVVGEASIGSGLRRVEALAGAAADDYLGRQLEALDEVARTLGAPRDEALARVKGLLADLAEARRRLEAAERRAAQQGLEGLLAAAQEVVTPTGPVRVLAAEVPAASAPTMERLREVSDWLRDKLAQPSALVLASVPNGRPQLLAVVSKELTARGLHAGALLDEVARAMDGRAGGRPELAQGGGGDPAKLAAALARGRQAALAQVGVAPAP